MLRPLPPRPFLFVACAALCGGAALAQVAAPMTPSEAGPGRATDRQTQQVVAANRQADAAFRRADKDGDGRLSRNEADHLPQIAARFEQLDLNRDQFVSREEFNRVLAP